MKIPSLLLAFLISLPLAFAQAPDDASSPGISELLQEHSEGSVDVESYRLRPKDQLALEVFGESDLTTVSEIGRDGRASFHLLEAPVDLEGLTLDEARAKIWGLYEADYLVNPKITLSVARYAQEHVTVSGQVVASGPVPIPLHGKLSLFTAITNANGLSPFADDQSIQVFSTEGEVREFTLDEVRGDIGKKFMLSPYDQIVVPKNRFAQTSVSVQGEVGRQGTVPIPPDGQLDFATALIVSQGLSPEADRSRIELIRASGGSNFYKHESIIDGSAGKILLKAGDRIVVHKSRFVGKQVAVLGEVNGEGFIPFPPNGELTIEEAILKAGGFNDLANKKVILERKGHKAVTYDLDDLAKDGLAIYLYPGDTIRAKRRIW